MLENPFRVFRDADAETQGSNGPQPKQEEGPENEELLSVSEGWKAKSSLAGELGVTQKMISDIAEGYRLSNPEYFNKFKNVQGKPFEYYSPELVEIIEKKVGAFKEVPKPPAGWKNRRSICDSLNTTYNAVDKISKKYRTTNPEYFGEFKDAVGKINEHFSPELIKIIEEETSKFKEAPENWKMATTLSRELKEAGSQIDVATLKKFADSYRKSNPEYFAQFKTKTRTREVREHYSPELIKILTEKVAEFKELPAGWRGVIELANDLGVVPLTIARISEPYRKSNPDYFGKFRNDRGNMFEGYSPELVEIIKKEIVGREDAPEGWKTITTLLKELGIGPDKILEIASPYRTTNPEYFGNYKDKVSRITEYYSPEIIKIMHTEVLKLEKKAPEGWRTATSLYGEWGVEPKMLARIAEQFRKEHPEYFGQFRDPINRVREHYSPELIKIIKEKIDESAEAPAGWMSTTALSDELGVTGATISKAAGKYRVSNPEYFKDYKEYKGEKSRLNEHYSPELVSIIKEKFKDYKETQKAPEGWRTNRTVSGEIGISQKTVRDVAEGYRESNPEYFKKFRGSLGRIDEYYSPELVEIIREKYQHRNKENFQEVPEGWETNYDLATKLGVHVTTTKIIADKYRGNPEYILEFRDKADGVVKTYYSPELIRIITEQVLEYKDVPEGWKTKRAISDELKIDIHALRKIINRYNETSPEYVAKYKDAEGKVRDHYSPQFIEIIRNEVNEISATPESPEGWKDEESLVRELKSGPVQIAEIVQRYRKSNLEYFGIYRTNSNSEVHEFYSPSLVEIIIEEHNKIENPPTGWKTNNSAAEEIGVIPTTAAGMADAFRESNPEYFKNFRHPKMNVVREYYSPELIEILRKEVLRFSDAPEGWKTEASISTELGINHNVVSKLAEIYRKSNPEYFAQYKHEKGPIREHYSPELVEILKKELAPFIEQKESRDQEEKLKSDFENLVEGIANPETADEGARKIAEIIRLLPGNAHDIIIKYHPRYKGLHPDYVKQVIADYLGDFMLVKNEWQPSDVQKLKEVMDIEGIQEEILLNLKNGCLTFVNSERKNNPEMDELAIVEAYFEKEQMVELAGSGIKEVENAINELREYYDSIFRLRDKKPGNITDTLREGRTFPDINQLVNIQELMDKNKMLIADEMGLGKSASAILTKEYLGLSCALVIMPSNVEDTWKNYLSDNVNEQGKQVGYFKQGLAPKVLVIESLADIERLSSETFDYILISQEKAGGEQYGKALEQVNFDMMIVDEVHKLKNIESGVRSQAVEALSNKISGENKYLALLSGTPVPNKVKDIAVTLKLLYPEKYKDFDSKEMVKRILYGDLVDLRSELLKRMQMKELATSIEMPKLTEEDVIVELAPEEREIYEILLEEDELTALDKIMLFRQFLMNPEILKVEPGFVGSKIEKLGETLRHDFETQNKIVVFVNGYVEGVIKGEHNIIQKLNLPEDVIIEEIHGDISQAERARIQNELKSSDQKMAVFVSGQTADVGVDFSGADGMIEYNDPWSKYEKKQQQGRVYREGLKHDLVVKTLVTKDSIEEGIRAYINAKEKAIEKLLKGIGNTEAEKKLLYNDSKLVNNDIETNAQLSKEYLSDWEKLMLHFGEGYESGEKRFRQELAKTGKEYAELYKKLGRLTYQGNNARVSATLIERMVEERGESMDGLRILDIASGPEMLKEASSGAIRDHIFSTDINIEHFATSADPEKTMSASYLNLPVRDGSVDYANLGFAFHQTSPIKYHKKNYERLQVLAEMNRALKPGGRAVISMLHNVQFANMERFEALVEQLGFKLVPEYTGEAKGKESYKAGIFTLEKVSDIPEYKSDAQKFDSADNAKYINSLGDKLGREFLQGLEMSKTLKGKSRLRDQRRMIDRVTLGGKEIEVILNGKDRALLDEEVRSIQDGEDLRTQYGGIQNIPIEEIKRIGFERKLETPGYYLLYKIIKDGGAVIIRGDYKPKTKKEVKEP